MHHSLRDTTNPAEGYSDETAAANKCILPQQEKEHEYSEVQNDPVSITMCIYLGWSCV